MGGNNVPGCGQTQQQLYIAATESIFSEGWMLVAIVVQERRGVDREYMRGSTSNTGDGDQENCKNQMSVCESLTDNNLAYLDCG